MIDIYCIDSSVWIKIKDEYPIDIFPSLWSNIIDLINKNRVITPKEVINEIFDEEILIWIKDYEDLFVIDLNAKQIEKVKDVVRNFPDIVDYEKERPDADPFIIGLVLARKEEESTSLITINNVYIVVTDESPTKRGYRKKIPYVCSQYGIECINLFQFFRREGWTF